MKARAIIRLLLLNTIAVVAPTWAQTFLTIGTDDWPPYEFVQNTKGKSALTGFSTEVVLATLQQMSDVQLSGDIQLMPFARLEAELIRGRLDAAFSLSPNAKREQCCLHPSEPIVGSSRWLMYIKKEHVDKLKYESFDDLKGKVVGVVRAYAYTPVFWQFLEKERNYIALSNDEQSFKMLMADRLDYVIAESGNSAALIKKLNYTGSIIAFDNNPIRETELHIMFNKDRISKEFVDHFSAELKAFKSTDKYQKIYSKYF